MLFHFFIDGKLDFSYHYRPNFGGVFGFGARAAFEAGNLPKGAKVEIVIQAISPE